MADALISLVIETLGSMAFEKIKEEVGLIKGVDEEIESLKTTLQDIQTVLDDAEKRQLSDLAVRNWLEKLKDASLDMDDLLDEWMTPIALKSKMDQETQETDEKAVAVKKKVWRSLLSLCICSRGGAVDQVIVRHRVAKEIKELNENLARIAKAKNEFKLERADHVDDATLGGAASRERKISTSLINEREVCGREMEKEILVNKLFGIGRSDDDVKGRGFGIVSVVGLGGLGKTTLAQLVYNDDRIKNHFGSRIWVCVSDPFDQIKVAKEILGGLNGTFNDSDGLNVLVQRIHELVEGKKFFLVLDDVWNERHEKWEELEKSLGNGAVGSMILVTTRNENVSVAMRVAKSDMIALENLSDEHCWQIFSHRAFFDRTEEECKQLEEIGRKIAGKSKGLPLIAKTLGGLMSFKKTINQWNTVLNNKLWEWKDPNQELFAPFLLSYCDLSPLEKRCLLYCSVFPMDYNISVGKLIRMWMSQGLLGCKVNLEGEGEDCFESLARRSFFQDFEKNEFDESIMMCKMHDIVCDFVRFMTKDEYRVVEELVNGCDDEKDNALNERTRHLTISAHGIKETLASLKYNEKDKTKLRTLFFGSKYFSHDHGTLFFHQTRIRTLIFSNASSAMLMNINKLIHLRYLQISGAVDFENKELPDTICDLYNMQTLDLSSSYFEKLPENIGKLVNLRYLDLYFTYIRTLPDSICNLSKLQTLRLDSCLCLTKLPKDLGKLVELRHLSFSSCLNLDGLPKGIASLTGLRTLSMEFQVTKDRESNLNVGDLKALQHVLKFQRYFFIKGCSNIQNASEAREIGVTNMELLAELRLSFGYEQFGEMEDHEKEILEALKPSPNLQSLEISAYLGTTISPKWLLSLNNLTILGLHNFPNCSKLPPLGAIPSLRQLEICDFHMVEEVGPEFLGLQNLNIVDEELDCITGEKPSFISFPKLEYLAFVSMKRWKSWILGNTTLVEASSILIMPRLFRLQVSFCESLKELPDFLPWPTLKELFIIDCKILTPQCEGSSGTIWDKISHIPTVTVI